MLLPAVTPSLAQFQFVVLEAPPWPANENTARKPLSLYTEAAKKTIHLILISHLQPPVVTLPLFPELCTGSSAGATYTTGQPRESRLAERLRLAVFIGSWHEDGGRKKKGENKEKAKVGGERDDRRGQEEKRKQSGW